MSHPPCTDPSPGSPDAAVDLLLTGYEALRAAEAIERIATAIYDDARIGPPGLVLVSLDQLVDLIDRCARARADLATTVERLRAWRESGEATPWRHDAEREAALAVPPPAFVACADFTAGVAAAFGRVSLTPEAVETLKTILGGAE